MVQKLSIETNAHPQCRFYKKELPFGSSFCLLICQIFSAVSKMQSHNASVPTASQRIHSSIDCIFVEFYIQKSSTVDSAAFVDITSF